jgi:Nif-specific regulatory protein
MDESLDNALAGATTAEVTLDPRTPLARDETSLDPERVRTLYDVGRELLEQADPDEVRETLRRTIVRVLAPENACLLAIRDGRLLPVFVHGFNADQPFEAWPLSHTVLHRAQQTGLAVLATDATHDERLRDAKSVQALRIRSVLCVPLGNPPRALLYLDRRIARAAFGRADLAFLTALSVYVNLILERTDHLARTSDALRRSVARYEALSALPDGEAIVGQSPALLRVIDDATRLARQGARVLLLGESGTGKELLARLYAREVGLPFVPVAIPTLAPGLVESELFGHVRGAFPGAVRDKLGLLEAAEDGVLFLDEIGDTEPAIQTKLLRFLESGEIRRVGDTRVRTVKPLIVSGTNRPLEAELRQGHFRADLLARLGHVLRIPPLRERLDDVSLLVEHFARLAARGHAPKVFAPEALERLRRHDWPLNVRELRQVVDRMTCLFEAPIIEAGDLPDFVSSAATLPPGLPGAPTPLAPRAAETPLTMQAVLDESKRRHLTTTLAYTKGNRAEAVRLLGISTDTFYRWLKELAITPP